MLGQQNSLCCSIDWQFKGREDQTVPAVLAMFLARHKAKLGTHDIGLCT